MDYSYYRGRGIHKRTGYTRPLTYLPNVVEWPQDIICLEAENELFTADEVLGGQAGISNAQAQALANRTAFLKDNLFKLTSIVIAMQNALAPYLANIKGLVVGVEPPDDWEHFAWLAFNDDAEYQQWRAQWQSDKPAIDMDLENGASVNMPVIELHCEDGKVYVIRADGTVYTVPDVQDELDPDALEE